jgi:hypothetical protein
MNPAQTITSDGTLLISDIGNDWKEGKIIIHFYNFTNSNQMYSRQFNVANLVDQISIYYHAPVLIKHLRISKIRSINVLKKKKLISILLEQVPQHHGRYSTRVRLFFNISTNEQDFSISNIDDTTIFNCTRPRFINPWSYGIADDDDLEMVEFGNKYVVVGRKQINVFNSEDVSFKFFSTIKHKFSPALINE